MRKIGLDANIGRHFQQFQIIPSILRHSSSISIADENISTSLIIRESVMVAVRRAT